jgi:hypothetical protein
MKSNIQEWVAFTQGASRMVLLVGPYALKFPTVKRWELFLHGLLSNMQEAKFSATNWPELCPVLFALPGGLLVVMPRCTTLSEKLTREEYQAFTDRPDYVIPAENKADSFGYMNGRLVAVDYG